MDPESLAPTGTPPRLWLPLGQIMGTAVPRDRSTSGAFGEGEHQETQQSPGACRRPRMWTTLAVLASSTSSIPLQKPEASAVVVTRYPRRMARGHGTRMASQRCLVRSGGMGSLPALELEGIRLLCSNPRLDQRHVQLPQYGTVGRDLCACGDQWNGRANRCFHHSILRPGAGSQCRCLREALSSRCQVLHASISRNQRSRGRGDEEERPRRRSISFRQESAGLSDHSCCVMLTDPGLERPASHGSRATRSVTRDGLWIDQDWAREADAAEHGVASVTRMERWWEVIDGGPRPTAVASLTLGLIRCENSPPAIDSRSAEPRSASSPLISSREAAAETPRANLNCTVQETSGLGPVRAGERLAPVPDRANEPWPLVL